MERAIMREVLVGAPLSVLTLTTPVADPVALSVLAPHAVALACAVAAPGTLEVVCAVPAGLARVLVHALADWDPVCEHEMVAVALHGAGMRSDPVVAPTFCEAVASAGISLRLLTLDATSLSVVCRSRQAAAAVSALRQVFELPERGLSSRGTVRLGGSSRPR